MSDTAASLCLTLEDFQPLPRPPFNASIRISQAVAWFDGRLYTGGGRGPLRDHRMRAGGMPGGSPDAVPGAEEGAQIACYDPATGLWDLVYDSPLDGAGVARDRSVRALVVYQGPGDAAPALYAAIGSLQGQVVLLRSTDGRAFTPCGAPGLGQGDADIAAVRNLCVLENRLYTSPVGMNNARGWADDNVAEMPVVLCAADPAAGEWEIVSDPCFGDAGNESINEMIVFNGTLYAATLNRLDGFQLWRASGLGGNDPVWVKVLERGAGRGPANPVPAAMQVFAGALYIGTGVQRQPGEAADRFGPIAPELIRVWPDDRWELIVGEARFTPQGLRMPLSGQGPGFDDPFVQTFWRMAVHEGVLYLGGSDWRFWPTYLPRGARARPDILPETQAWLRQQTEGWQGDYGLWCSADGVNWQAVTTTGLGGSRAQYGIRELISTPLGLIVVPAAKMGAGDDADGGIEIWLGAAS